MTTRRQAEWEGARVAGVHFTVVFEEQPAGGFAVIYRRDGERIFEAPAAGPIAPILKEVAQALVEGEPEMLERLLNGQTQTAVGEALYALMFPGDCQPLFKALHRAHTGLRSNNRIDPSRLQARVRIQTDDALLQILPWQLTGPEGRPLSLRAQDGWTFELTSTGRMKANPQLLGPPPILAIIPGEDGVRRFHALRQTLVERQPAYASQRFLTLAQTRAAVLTALREMRPTIIYFVGHAEQPDQAPVLKLDDGDLTGQTLREHCTRVQVAIFAGCGTAHGGRSALGRYLADCVPAVISSITRIWRDQAVLLSEHWLRLIALDGVEPVEAVHQRPDTARLAAFHAWSYAVHAYYDTWTVEDDAQADKSLRGKVSHRLDRKTQRARLLLQAGELRRAERRVLAVIGFSSEDDSQLPDELSDLLLEDLKTRCADQFVFEKCVVDMPADPRWMSRAIKQGLDGDPGANLTHLLSAAAPEADVTATLWLDFGTFGKRFTALKTSQFDAWLHACDEIAAHCPPDLRVIAFMAIDSKSHEKLAVRAGKFELKLQSGRLLVEPLSVLLHVDLMELHELFVAGGTSCLPSMRRDVVEALFDSVADGASRANYRDLVNEIDYAESIGWQAWLNQCSPSLDDSIDI